jgi:benzoyl-CoA reductase/2-hydroxyglutaryl-CoA dehydratase subunit BcrC/BadD/HgdB
MTKRFSQISLGQWECRNQDPGLPETGPHAYRDCLERHFREGDVRLGSLRFDPSPAALNLWSFLLSENDRLCKARKEGKKLVGAMKDLGTVPVMAYAFPGLTAFYPDGAWWIPCVMEGKDGLLDVADRFGLDESFCPVRAMFGAFVDGTHFPPPDLAICSVGAVCDDFSAIAQRVEGIGQKIFWWEIPRRRAPEPSEIPVRLPGGGWAAAEQVAFVKKELERVQTALSGLSGVPLTRTMLRASIRRANEIREILRQLRTLTFTAKICPLPALELLIAEMMALHYCSDRDQVRVILSQLLETVSARAEAGAGFLDAGAARIYWVNPVADLRVMNWLEACGGRICGTEYLFTHALDPIPESGDPLEALARTALADPMVGSGRDRASRILRDVETFGAEAVVISKIPGASHCGLEGRVIGEYLRSRGDLPVIEIEVPPVSDSVQASLKTRLSALVETVKEKRGSYVLCGN